MNKIVKYIGIILVVLLILPLLPAFLIYRKYLQYKITKARHRRLCKGINLLTPINIGGIPQWISVRGENKDNPILLILHAGPFFSMMPYSYLFAPLESTFTIVQWDQRGTGKTRRTNKHLDEDITPEQLQADAAELVNDLCHRFNKEKIFIYGHSWGSILGLTLAHDHPALIQAYVGTGQVVNLQHNEQTGYDHTLKLAYEKDNKQAIKDLEKLTFPKKQQLDSSSLDEFKMLRKWQFKLNPLLISKSTLISSIMHFLTEPDYSLIDYYYLTRGILWLGKSKNFFNQLMKMNIEDKVNFRTNIYIFGGRKDHIANAELTYHYFQKICAPYKKHIWFEHSGHNLPFEETSKFMESLSSAIN